MIGIETIIGADHWRRALPNVEALADAVFAAAHSKEPRLAGSVALLLADDAALRDLNARFRGKDSPTNVLSFPSAGRDPGFLGDVALAYETCAAEARARGIALAAHAAHLIAHGLLHLAGHDHEEEDEAVAMETLEAEILGVVGVADPYAAEAHAN